MYEHYTDKQIVEMLVPKLNKSIEGCSWGGLIRDPERHKYTIKAFAIIYRLAYIRGQFGQSFIIDDPQQIEHWIPATKDNVKIGSKVRMINGKLHNETPRWFPVVGTVGIVRNLCDINCDVQWPKGTTSWQDKWWCNYEHLEVLLCE